MIDHESMRLLDRVRANDASAEEELFHRYARRLLALVCTRMTSPLARRLDPDDIVQSAYRSFFIGAREGKFYLEASGDLWRLLAAITLNKLAKKREYHGAARRNVFTEATQQQVDDSRSAIDLMILADDPTPDQAAALIDEMVWLANGLSEEERTMLDMRIVGYELGEIARAVCRSERTVRRSLDKVKIRLRDRLSQDLNG